MSRLLHRFRVAAAVVASLAVLAGCAHLRPGKTQPEPLPPSHPDLGFIELDSDITLRRLVVRNAKPKGTVLLLHGFPETLLAWKDVSAGLANDFEVHAFDWPGYGLSSRPPPDRFAYAPRDYARVLKAYIEKSGIDASNLVVYATDIGALPALLLALDEPRFAKAIIVGDFAPLDRPGYMVDYLQALKSKPSSEAVHAAMNNNRDDILENAFRRGLAKEEQYELAREFKEDMAKSWSHNGLSSADAFYHYYAHFTADQDLLDMNLAKLKTPMKVVWGEKDFYIKPEMGIEFADRARAELTVLPGVGHYPHLQDPGRAIAEIRASSATAPGASR